MPKKLQTGSSTLLHCTKDCEVCPNEFRLELLMDIDMLLIVEKGIQGGLPKQLSVLPGLIINAWKIYTIPMKREYIFHTWMEITFMDGQWFKTYQHIDFYGRRQKTWIDEIVKKDKRGYLLEVDVEYLKQLHENHNELPFLADRMKIRRGEKLVPNLKDKKGYVVHIKKLSQALKHGLKGTLGYWVPRK